MLVLRQRTWRWHDEIGGSADALSATAAGFGASLLALQYNPFSYARGLAPGLVAEIAQVRRSAIRVAIVVHEPYVNTGTLKLRILGHGQRAQLRALMGLAQDVLVTTQEWRHLLPGRLRAGVSLAVAGSNLPDRRAARSSTRAQLGVSDRTLVCVTFGLHAPHQQLDHVRKALAIAQSEVEDVLHLNLGRVATPLKVSGVSVMRPGPQPADELASMLAAGDIFLAPYTDGATTRRGSLAAAVQHGIATVATASTYPWSSWKHGGLWLTAADDDDAFAAAVGRLAADPELRARAARDARAMFERLLAWPVAIEPYVRLASERSDDV